MKVKDLIERLQVSDPDLEIMILSGDNGSGYPREINLGPVNHRVTQEDADCSADCEDIVGKGVLIIGFGYY